MTHLHYDVNIYYDPFLLLCKLTKSLHIAYPKELFPAQASYELRQWPQWNIYHVDILASWSYPLVALVCFSKYTVQILCACWIRQLPSQREQ